MKECKATRPNGQEYRGVRYREHPTRRHGLHPDRYYIIRYWAKGKTQNEGIGWASEGVKPSDAHERLIDIKKALKAGTYETSAEHKAREQAEHKAEALLNDLAGRSKTTHDIAALSLYAGLRFGEITALFASRPKGKPTAYVFPDKKHGGRIGKISSAFMRAVNELKLNGGIEDRRLDKAPVEKAEVVGLNE